MAASDLVATLKEIILEFWATHPKGSYARHLRYEVVPNKAFVCVGIRRCGKSTFLQQLISDLRAKGIARENIVYLNFFDDRLRPLRAGGMDAIQEAYFSLYPEKKDKEKTVFFFDEIQEMPDWEPFVDRLMRTEKCAVFITGSSARMLSREIATQMRGRALTWELFPFSFAEFLGSRGLSYDIARLPQKKRLLIQKGFAAYWESGGFPEVLDATPRVRLMIHQEYFKTIVERDLVERHDLAHPRAAMDLAFRLLNSVSCHYSINRLTEFLKSRQYAVTKAFVSECLDGMEDAYFLYSTRIFHRSLSVQNANTKKIYAADPALVRSVISRSVVNSGHLLENLVFIHLRRSGLEIHYYRTHDGREVDFLVIDANGEKQLIQVCESLSEEATFERETRALQAACGELRLYRATLVTRAEDRLLTLGRIRIHVVPIWKFLLTPS